MLQLVIEGEDRYRKILACGVMNQIYTGDIRLIDGKNWTGHNKLKSEWDEQEKKLIPKRQETLDAEQAVKNAPTQEDRIALLEVQIRALLIADNESKEI